MAGGKRHFGKGAKILFVEAEPWEHDDLLHKCPHGCQVHSRQGRLEELSDGQLPTGISVLSTFVNSRVTGEQIDRLKTLRFIGTRSTGYDHIDIPECDRRGIVVSNVPHYGENTVAEHAFGLLLALTRKIHRCYERTVRGDFSIAGLRGTDLYGRTFGALGTGNIARHALRIAGGFGMRRIACDIAPQPELARRIGFEYVGFDELLRRSDVLSIHVPYNAETHHMIDADALSRLPRGAIVLNTARGGIIDPQALIEALKSGYLGGAGLDVLEGETAIAEEAELMSSAYNAEMLKAVVRNHALLRMPNVIITPHVAFNSHQAVGRIIDTTIENIHAFLEGKPRNVVSALPGNGRA